MIQKKQDIGAINDPFDQTHSLASRSSLWFALLDFEKWGRTDVCANNCPYRPWLWVGRVDQYLIYALSLDVRTREDVYDGEEKDERCIWKKNSTCMGLYDRRPTMP